MNSTPRTKAARQFLDNEWRFLEERSEVVPFILAIEAEAEAAPALDVERLARALREVIGGPNWKGQSTIDEFAAEVAAAYSSQPPAQREETG